MLGKVLPCPRRSLHPLHPCRFSQRRIPQRRSLLSGLSGLRRYLFPLFRAFHYLGRNTSDRTCSARALCLIGLSWFLATFIGAIPYLLIVEGCTFSDALFECSSGLTTTGATAFNNFYEFPASLLFWRSLSQWMGGLGVVVFFVALYSPPLGPAPKSSLVANPPDQPPILIKDESSMEPSFLCSTT